MWNAWIVGMSVAHVVLAVMAALVFGCALATLYAEFMPVIRRRLSGTRELMQAGEASLSRYSVLARDHRADYSPRDLARLDVNGGPFSREHPLFLYGSWRGPVYACDKVGNLSRVRARNGVRRLPLSWPRFLRECRQNSKRPRRGIG